MEHKTWEQRRKRSHSLPQDSGSLKHSEIRGESMGTQSIHVWAPRMAKIVSFFQAQFPKLLKSYQEFIKYLFQESDATRLGAFRILFGLCMFLDVFQERGLEDADIRFGNSNHCFFPLFPRVKPVSVQMACVFYSLMWIGSLGMVLGYKFRIACSLYFAPYLYFLLLDKSRWNNHSYLFGLTVVLLFGSNATASLSLDGPDDKMQRNKCPNWNYFILRFQFTILYFMAAVKKIDPDWLAGYSMKNISKHKILSHFSNLVGEEFLAYYLIHLGGFAFDFLAGFLLNFRKTRRIGFLLSFLFHGLNSQLFDIGMFPYVCLSSLILFSSSDESSWFKMNLFSRKVQPMLKSKEVCDPRTKCRSKIRHMNGSIPAPPSFTTNSSSIRKNPRKERWITVFLLAYMSLQITLPFTHSITKGFNNWTKGLYGYSWDMMVYSWDTLHTKITVKDYVTGGERYLDPGVWTTNERWSSHADMAKQYADCIARNLATYNITTIEVYFDIWKSLNGRFQQRIFDPRVDILKAPWSPWEEVPWVLPLLHEFSNWREVFEQISEEVGNWTESSNVIFVADYPSLTLENYLSPQLDNVSLIILKGEIIVEQPGMGNVTLRALEIDPSRGFLGNSKVSIVPDGFHKIHTVSTTPSCYMYTYRNKTEDSSIHSSKGIIEDPSHCLMNKFCTFLQNKWTAFYRSFLLIVNSYLNIIFDVPMVFRKKLD